jgi:hypothetical protein
MDREYLNNMARINKKLNQENDSSVIEREQMAATIEANKNVAYNHRRIHERRWYDNNFFDDGFHFRYLSRTTNKIVDLSERATIYTPQRAIPKASRQIRGIANLLLSSDPTPTVYPEEVPPTIDEKLKQQLEKLAKGEAEKRGYWLEEQWREADASGETILENLAFAVILSAKHSISYIKLWPDRYGKIRHSVKDAFDLYVIGSYTNLEDCPFCYEATPQLVSQIKSNEDFDKEARSKVLADNKSAESEIKQAYQKSRYGQDTSSDLSGTAILYEAYTKEYLNSKNIARIRLQKDADMILKDRKLGDCIIRQTFMASGQILLDTYLNMDEYPYVDVRFEPGPLYQVPLIERFKDANKSLDSAVSRLERYFHTMVTGIWLKRRGEQFKINNIAGGQVIEYDQKAPEQAQLASPGQWTFEFLNLLTGFIEEQGVSTTLGKIPTGVKAHAAIESMKEQEYANLVIAHRRLKEVCRRIALKMFAIADDHFVTPQSTSYTSGGKTTHFQVIGKNALARRKGKKIETPGNLVTLSKDTKVDIEIEQGMAYTREGKKETMQNLINTMLQWAQAGVVSPDALKVIVQKYLEVYQFGSTAEFMDALDIQGLSQGLNEAQMMQMKTALLQALQDAGEVGPEADQTHEQITKFAVLSALKDAGLVKHIQDAGGAANAQPVKESVEINYKDAPEDIKRQMEQEAGFQPSQTISPAATDQIVKHKQLEQSAVQGDRQHEIAQKQLQVKGGKNDKSK